MSRRREDPRFLTGTGRYVSDLIEPGDLHAQFVRSPLAHGTIVEIERDQIPDGAIVYTAADLDLPAIDGGPFSDPGFDRSVLASDRVRYVGEPVAVVVAQSKVAAVDAAESIWVDVDPLDAVGNPANAESGPALFPSGNVVRRASTGAFDGRPHEMSVTVSVENQRLAPAALEGLAIRAEPDGDGGLIVHCGHQAPHRLRNQLADHLGLESDKVRVIVPDVGGGFGLKGMYYPEYVVVCVAAIRIGRPVVWIEGRRESFLNSAHGRAQHHTVTLHGDSKGNLAAAEIEILADVGAYPHNGALIPGLSTFVAQGLYDFEQVKVDATTVVTNLAPTGSYRGAGRPEAAYAVERAIDAYAREAGLDPVDVRVRNLIQSERLPLTTHTGARYDSGDYRGALKKAIAVLGAEEVHALREERRGSAVPVGVGVGMFVERAGGASGTGEFGSIEVTEEGNVVVRAGTASAGQGHETVWADLAAAVLSVSPEDVEVIAGDTGQVDDGVGTYASRSAQMAGSAIKRTGEVVVDQLKKLAGEMLEASPADLTLEDGRVHVVGDPDSGLSLAELAAASDERLIASEMFIPDNQTFPYGAHIAVVEVETETGEVRILRYVAVDDCGIVLNPMIVSGQVVGSLAQGYGQAVLESIVYSESGEPLTTSFMDYLIPAAGDTPSFIEGRTVTPAPSNPLGVKGTGEAGCIGAPPAIVNAVLDALAPIGVTHLDMPLRPSRVWEAIQQARKEQ